MTYWAALEFYNNYTKQILPQITEINETYKEKISFNKRLIFLYVTFGILGVVFYYQIFNLQISNYSEYEIAAENNKNEEISVQPLRGIIFDRNGEILVNNIPTFDLITKPFFIDDPDDFLLKLSSFLEIDEEDKKVFLSQFKKAKTLNKELTLKHLQLPLQKKILKLTRV